MMLISATRKVSDSPMPLKALGFSRLGQEKPSNMFVEDGE